MSIFVRILTKHRSSDRGTSIVEYGLLIGLIAIVSLAAMGSVGSGTEDQFEVIAAGLSGDETPGAVDDDTSGGQSPGGDDESGEEADDESGTGGSGGGGNEVSDPNHGQSNDPSADDDQSSDQDPGDGANTGSDDENGAGGDENGNGSTGDDSGSDDGNGNGGSGDDSGSGDGNGNGGSGDDSGSGDVVEPEPPAEPGSTVAQTSSASSFYWWNKTKKGGEGAWKASVTYQNDWIRHQYLTLEVTRVDDRGRTSVSTVSSFYVPAGGASTFDLWDNELVISNGKADGIVSVSVKVTAIKTSDKDWKTVSYPGVGTASVIEVPETP